MSSLQLTLAKPSTLTLEITSECNLRCKQCYLWRETDPVNSLTTEEKAALIRQYGEWGPSGGALTLVGGEPFRKVEETFTLCREARKQGLVTLLVSNGTLIDPSLFERLCFEGPKYLVLSLDAPRAEIHDWIRGKPGTFARLTETLRALRTFRDQRAPSSDLRILVNGIVCKATLPHLPELVDLSRDLGADSISLNVLWKTILNEGPRDPFFEDQSRVDLELLDRTVDALIERQARKVSGDIEIVGQRLDLEWMKSYFRQPQAETLDLNCDSIYRNLIVNKFGDISLCNFEWEYFGHNLGNVREQSLQHAWRGERAREIREKMKTCRQGCGMLHCHRKGVIAG
ncbi:MAG: radical SAM/SPASM domain-containing protein [Bdellovibrionota bacterium]